MVGIENKQSGIDDKSNDIYSTNTQNNSKAHSSI